MKILRIFVEFSYQTEAFMEKNGKPVASEAQNPNAQNGCTVVLPSPQEQKVMVVCDVCGHANPQYTALCEMCSNYLMD